MSKAAGIRKKALDAARKQDWDTAIREYQRLAEVDAANPNVYNELGDVYLKTGNKTDAYDAYVRAVDAYTRVSLFNNAVAVCKKVVRLIPGRVEILTKLGMVRNRQGIVKEAEKHYIAFMDRIDASPLKSEEEATLLTAIVEEMNSSPKVLERVLDHAMQGKVEEAIEKALISLYRLYKRDDDAADRDRVVGLMEKYGVVAEETAQEPEPAPEPEGRVITEENIWTTQGHSDGERIDMDREDGIASPERDVPSPGADGDAGRSVYEMGNVELPDSGPTPAAASASEEYAQTPAGSSVGSQTVELPPIPDGETAGDPESSDTAPNAPREYEIPAPDDATVDDTGSNGGDVESIQVSAMMSELGEPDASGDEDHRSHYDLGMAYLEMNLFSEAIREYQVAAKSPEYQVRSLEMIGLCFLNQNQPGLAIKQLAKGLELVGTEGRETLGIKYNLGLAYEMAGDAEKARSMFEDVYVVDVGFRDVAEKIARYTE